MHLKITLIPLIEIDRYVSVSSIYAKKNHSLFYLPVNIHGQYLLDVLCRQQIKLFQVVSTSEFHEYQWNNVVFIFFCPLGFLEDLRSLKH